MLPHSIELRRAYIAFEAEMDLKAAKKLAKSIMKEPEFRNSVLLCGRLGKGTLGDGNKDGLFHVRPIPKP